MKQWLLLFLWLGIGTALRLTQLEAKPPWTDEFSTIVFSLGNSFHNVPLDRAISLDVLLQPLQANPNASIDDVIKHLFEETNHPPLYFVLAHWWMGLFRANFNGLASVWVARSLSVLFGVLSIPAIYGLSWLAFRSRLISQLTAAMMAVSPYGIFIAQEARHYTLAILWGIASLSCLVIATRCVQLRIFIPIWVVIVWICINSIGISTHYFLVLTLVTEALWLIFLAWHQSKQVVTVIVRRASNPKHLSSDCECVNPTKNQRLKSYLFSWQIAAVVFGTTVGVFVWLPIFLHGNRGGELTKWIQNSDRSFLEWISPIFQALGTWVSMLYLFPVSAELLIIVIISGLGMLGFFIWVLPILKHGIVTMKRQPDTSLMTQLFGVVVLGGVAIFFIFTYIFGIDLTRGARYYFVYFPAVIVLIGASLAVCWQTPNQEAKKKQKFLPNSGKTAVTIIILVGVISGLVVVGNLGYPKYYRPDLFVPIVQKVSRTPVLIATTHRSHVQTGEMMGLAREFKIQKFSPPPLFLLAHQSENLSTSTAALQQTLGHLPKPLDVWLVNFYAPIQLDSCIIDSRSLPSVNGYRYQIYHCSPATS